MAPPAHDQHTIGSADRPGPDGFQSVAEPKPVAPDGNDVDLDFLRRPLAERLATPAVFKNGSPSALRFLAGLSLREDDSIVEAVCLLIEAAHTAEAAAQKVMDGALRQELRKAGVAEPPPRLKLNLPTLTGALRGMVLANDAPGRCATCAFRRGTPANCAELTISDAENCVDSGEEFRCHEHGDPDGEGEHLCRGFVQAREARRLA